ncbi:hypothetical protein RCL_jg21617.t1 [Rhizophagus clarus]|uniref:Uncharacterized protein n=1 Tax=Rhizophagus clarus TaxID=94130 RepID=A0A8H3QFB4_9GLOM|nr:hypothetical protein RCL_jg21617.t1 [Rhizophagus clarus]
MMYIDITISIFIYKHQITINQRVLLHKSNLKIKLKKRFSMAVNSPIRQICYYLEPMMSLMPELLGYKSLKYNPYL